ncbi:MAG: hypothetical protein AB1746_01200 [Candidatus Zixiibacteriota bacterium]
MYSGFRFYLIFASILLSIICAQTVGAQDAVKYKGTFGLKFGYYGGGTLEVNTAEWETDPGLCFGTSLDFPLTHNFYLGAAVDVAQFKMWRESEYLLNMALLLKKRIPVGSGSIQIRPAAGLGYAVLNEMAFVDNTDYLTLQILNEFVAVINGKIGMSWDIGLFWALSGGNDIYDISGGPFLMVRMGVSI